jgi:hypothetical protein
MLVAYPVEQQDSQVKSVSSKHNEFLAQGSDAGAGLLQQEVAFRVVASQHDLPVEEVLQRSQKSFGLRGGIKILAGWTLEHHAYIQLATEWKT